MENRIYTQPENLCKVAKTTVIYVFTLSKEEVFPTLADTYIFMENMLYHERIVSTMLKINVPYRLVPSTLSLAFFGTVFGLFESCHSNLPFLYTSVPPPSRSCRDSWGFLFYSFIFSYLFLFFPIFLPLFLTRNMATLEL